MEIFGGIFINYVASLFLAGLFFSHVYDKVVECDAMIKHLGRNYTVRFNRGFGLVAWVACVLPGYSTMPVEWWWLYVSPITAIGIIFADIWLTKLENTAGYYKYILWMFGGLYGVSMLLSALGMIWRF